METSLKTGFAQISLAAQKIWVAQNLGRLQPPLAPWPVHIWTAHTLAWQRVSIGERPFCAGNNGPRSTTMQLLVRERCRSEYLIHWLQNANYQSLCSHFAPKTQNNNIWTDGCLEFDRSVAIALLFKRPARLPRWVGFTRVCSNCRAQYGNSIRYGNFK